MISISTPIESTPATRTSSAGGIAIDLRFKSNLFQNLRGRTCALHITKAPFILKEYPLGWSKSKISQSKTGFAYLMLHLRGFKNFMKSFDIFRLNQNSFALLRRVMSRYGSTKICLKTCHKPFSTKTGDKVTTSLWKNWSQWSRV